MQVLRNPLESVEGQLAFDEAALLIADELGCAESVRVWSFDRPVVVLGRSSKINDEVQRAYCAQHSIPVLRRCSGGASIVAGPGCLMYSVVLSFERRPELQKIDVAHRFVMGRLLVAVQRQIPEARMQGTCDLTWNDCKFSGNSLRLARKHLLYHGTLLHDADLASIANCLAHAPRQPEYRRERPHDAFITNVPVDPVRLARDVEDVFVQAEDLDPGQMPGLKIPDESLLARARGLLEERYTDAQWHERH